MDLNAIATAAVANLLESGKIEKAIGAAIEKTVLDQIEQQLRSYSDFGKAVGEALKESLAFKHLTLPEYNAILLDTFRQHVDAHMHATAAKSMKDLATDMLQSPPAEIKLSELVEEYKKWLLNNHSRDDLADEISVVVQRHDYKYSTWTSTSWTIGLHSKPDEKKEYMCDWRLRLSHASSDNTGPITISSIHLGKAELKTDVFLGGSYGFERQLFQLWCGKVAFVIDEEAVDLQLPEHVCEC